MCRSAALTVCLAQPCAGRRWCDWKAVGLSGSEPPPPSDGSRKTLSELAVDLGPADLKQLAELVELRAANVAKLRRQQQAHRRGQVDVRERGLSGARERPEVRCGWWREEIPTRRAGVMGGGDGRRQRCVAAKLWLTPATRLAAATVAAAVAPARMGVRRGRWHLRGDVAVQVGCGMAHHEWLQRAPIRLIRARPKLVARLEAGARGREVSVGEEWRRVKARGSGGGAGGWRRHGGPPAFFG